jgi:hypothetical protein
LIRTLPAAGNVECRYGENRGDAKLDKSPPATLFEKPIERAMFRSLIW